MELLFEWDAVKARSNREKHGISFEEARMVFYDPLSITILDRRAEEDRWVDLGVSAAKRLLVVVYTERGARIRIISARQATPTERRKYEQSSR